MLDSNDIAQIQSMIQDRESYAQYNVTPIPNHVHNGTDSPQIDAKNILNLSASTLGTLFTGNVEVLVVGTGGDGGLGVGNFPGGGGGGGMAYDATHQVIAHIGSDQAYPVVVGGVSSGINSTFDNMTGGFGGTGQSGSPSVAGTGGAGGTASGPGTNTSGGAGGNGNTSGAGSDGGNGAAFSITGSSVTYGGGGGGVGSTTQGAGGAGGGSAGNSGNGTSGLGGGAGGRASGSGPTGGKGVVIIRYDSTKFGPCTGGTITTDGVFNIHTFTSSGTFTVVAR